jgi:hypothetical protein
MSAFVAMNAIIYLSVGYYNNSLKTKTSLQSYNIKGFIPIFMSNNLSQRFKSKFIYKFFPFFSFNIGMSITIKMKKTSNGCLLLEIQSFTYFALKGH